MIREDNQKKCEAIMKKWGPKVQLLVLVEEMAELQKEILKNINREKDNVKEITEEAVDVYVMLEYLKAHYNISEKDIEKYATQKLDKVITTYGIEVL